jgi:hypothetical protein
MPKDFCKTIAFDYLGLCAKLRAHDELLRNTEVSVVKIGRHHDHRINIRSWSDQP